MMFFHAHLEGTTPSARHSLSYSITPYFFILYIQNVSAVNAKIQDTPYNLII